MKEETGDLQGILRYRLQQADRCVDAARLLSEHDDFAAALNRIYYGMFYAVTALALMRGFKTGKHHQLLGWFSREIVSSGLIEKDLGKALRNACEMRLESDYEALVSFELDEIEAMLPQMERFIAEVKRILAEGL